jgi:hypothetical protein
MSWPSFVLASGIFTPGNISFALDSAIGRSKP